MKSFAPKSTTAPHPLPQLPPSSSLPAFTSHVTYHGARNTIHRPLKPLAGQKQTNENKADAAAKTRRNKERENQAAVKGENRSGKNTQAAVLRDNTNVPGEPLSPEEQIAALTTRLESSEAKNDALSRKNPSSGVSRRRQRLTNVGRLEGEARHLLSPSSEDEDPMDIDNPNASGSRATPPLGVEEDLHDSGEGGTRDKAGVLAMLRRRRMTMGRRNYL
ncbi:hypothetical protein C8R44DRAFT_904111 [Mycena epipterygia]|nr:hypothetical protein C8R44DRAFT_904111 [Mycena epipterygia]